MNTPLSVIQEVADELSDLAHHANIRETIIGLTIRDGDWTIRVAEDFPNQLGVSLAHNGTRHAYCAYDNPSGPATPTVSAIAAAVRSHVAYIKLHNLINH